MYPEYIGPKLIVKRPPGLTDDDMPEYMELGNVSMDYVRLLMSFVVISIIH